MTKTQTDTTTASVPYSTHGRTRSWTYTYTPTGLVQTVTGPRTDLNDTVTYGYDASGSARFGHQRAGPADADHRA